MLIEPKDPPAVWVVTSAEKEEGLAKDTVASVVAKRVKKRDITSERFLLMFILQRITAVLIIFAGFSESINRVILSTVRKFAYSPKPSEVLLEISSQK